MREREAHVWRAMQGRPSSKALRRTFGQPVDSIRVHLYRDSAAWCAAAA